MSRRRSWTVLAVGMAAAVLIAMLVPSIFHANIAFGQIEAALARIKSLRIEIVRPALQDSKDSIQILYTQGDGYKLDSSERVEIDNGEHRWEYDKTQKKVVKYPSKLQRQGYPTLQLLSEAVGFPVGDDPLRDLRRQPDADQMLKEEKLECYAWSDQLGATTYEHLWYLDRAQRPRMISSRHRRDGDLQWQIDSLIRFSFEPIPVAEFQVDFGSDVEIVEANTKQVEIDGLLIDEDVFKTHENITKQWQRYYGLTFDLQVKVSREYGPDVDSSMRRTCRAFPAEAVEYVDQFSVLPPQENCDRPRRFWKRYTVDSDGNDVLISAVSFDGAASRKYSRAVGKKYHGGAVVGFEDMSPIDDTPNYFEESLFLRLNLINDRMPVAPEMPTFNLARMHLTATHQREQWMEGQFTSVRQDPAGPISYRVNVANEPYNRVVGYEVSLDSSAGNKCLGLLDLHNAGVFEGTWYPSAGVFKQTGYSMLDEVDYRFRVVNVSRLPADAAENWWIEWPLGTHVNDQLEKKNFIVGAEINNPN